MPKDGDVDRLKIVRDQYHANEIVLFEWNKKKDLTRFSVLDGNSDWIEKSPAEIFGKPEKVKKTAASTSSPAKRLRNGAKAADKAWVTRKANMKATDSK